MTVLCRLGATLVLGLALLPIGCGAGGGSANGSDVPCTDYAPQPVVTSVTPDAGSVVGGITRNGANVTVGGSGFLTCVNHSSTFPGYAVEVYFGDPNVQNNRGTITGVSDTSVSCISPPKNQPGTVDVHIVVSTAYNRVGISPTSSADKYTYQ